MRTDRPAPQPFGPTARDVAGLAEARTFGEGMPHAVFARLRRERPVAWVAEAPERGAGYWAVTRHAAVTEASRAPHVYSSGLRGAFLRDREGGRQLLVNMDAPRHLHLRRYVSRVFTPSAVRGLQDSVRAHARSLVDGLVAAGEFDLVRDLAAPMPLLVIGDLLGVPDADRELLLRWSNNLVGFDDPDYGSGGEAQYRQTFVDAFGYTLDVARERRQRPGDDLVSRIVTTEVDGRGLTDSEFCALWLLLVIAGNETTRHLISGGLGALLAAPDQLRRIVADPGLIPTAVDELMRWVTPIMQFRRTATCDTELDGQAIRKGDKVVLYFASANRDEAAFDSPEVLDVARTPNPHLAFGIGPHFCLGAHLARMEVEVLLEELLPWLPELVLTGPVARLESTFMNGIKAMPARFLHVGRTA